MRNYITDGNESYNDSDNSMLESQNMEGSF